VGKYHSNSQCFKEKNYKAKFSINSILKKKLTEIILEKKYNKKNKGKKPCWKHCSNSQCFVMKATMLPHMI
jgi:hypothetical protein